MFPVSIKMSDRPVSPFLATGVPALILGILVVVFAFVRGITEHKFCKFIVSRVTVCCIFHHRRRSYEDRISEQGSLINVMMGIGVLVGYRSY